MDSEILREQRRKRILENQRSRMDRILGVTGDRYHEPIIDGLGRASAIDDSRKSKENTIQKGDGETSDKNVCPEIAQNGGQRISQNSADSCSRWVNENSSVNERTLQDDGNRRAKKITQRSVDWKRSWDLRRQIMAVSLGVILRMLLLLAILPVDINLFPYFFAFGAVFESMSRFYFTEIKDLRTDQTGADQRYSYLLMVAKRLKALCWRLLDDFMLTLSGFVSVHLLISGLGFASDA